MNTNNKCQLCTVATADIPSLSIKLNYNSICSACIQRVSSTAAKSKGNGEVNTLAMKMDRSINSILELLSSLPLLVLDKYVLEVITDPSTLVDLLLAKMKHEAITEYIKELRSSRNKYIHKTMDKFNLTKFVKAIQCIQQWLKHSQFDNIIIVYQCLNSCTMIADIFGLTFPEVNPVSEDSKIVVGILSELKAQYHEILKGKTVTLVDREGNDRTAVFKGWNGTTAYFIADGRRISVNMNRTIRFTV